MLWVLRRLRIENLVLIREAELELDSGLNAITGETGAGKTILSNAIGLLLGARGEAGLIGAASKEAYVEAEFDLPDPDMLGDLAGLQPEGEDALVLARRIFADGRTRAYARGRSAAREDVAQVVESLLAMRWAVRAATARSAGLPACGARRLRGNRTGYRPASPAGPGATSPRLAGPTMSSPAMPSPSKGADRRAWCARRRHRGASSPARRTSLQGVRASGSAT